MPCCILGAAIFGLVMRRRSRRARQQSMSVPAATWTYDDDRSGTGARPTASISSTKGGA
jgi:hypothetical protein